MAKESTIKMRGLVTEVLPSTRFKVTLEENGHILTCTLGGRLRTNNIKILLHDQVEVEISPYDLEKGRIIYRF